LRGAGHEVRIPALGFNVDCGEASVEKLGQELVSTGDPAVLVGHSRGGQLARVLAVRHPGAVDRLVTVATPWTVGPPTAPDVGMVSAAIRCARRLGGPRFASIDCSDGPCCIDFRADLSRAPTCEWTAIWSVTDRVAGLGARPPTIAAHIVETRLSHFGSVTSPEGKRLIADVVSASTPIQ